MDKELDLAVTCYGKVKNMIWSSSLGELPNRIICTCLI